MLLAGVWQGFAPSHAIADNAVLSLAPDDQKAISDLLGPGVVIEGLPATPLAIADAYLPKNGPQLTYSVHEKGKGPHTELHRISVAGTKDPPGSTVYEVANVSRLVLMPDSDGGAAILQEYDLDKDVVSTFSPGEPLIISGLTPGQSRKMAVKVSVADIDDPTDIDYTGKLDVTYTHLGHYRIKLPSGSYEADLIKWAYSGDVGPASIETAQYRFLAKNAGMVAMVEWRSISAVLIYHEKSRIGKVLLGKP